MSDSVWCGIVHSAYSSDCIQVVIYATSFQAAVATLNRSSSAFLKTDSSEESLKKRATRK